MVRVKICGITNEADARAAAEAGADALGFVFSESPRRITPEKARAIIRGLPPFMAAVGVFVNEDPARVREIAAFCSLRYVQFHGDEPPEVCNAFGNAAIKAVRVAGPASLRCLGRYRVAAFLLDGCAGGARGGTGTAFPWRFAAAARARGRKIILAGGLTPENVAEAVAKVRPCAVDVSSGVESAPGRKDPARMSEFIRRAKGAPLDNARARRRR